MRWKVVITYRMERGPYLDVTHDIEELEELHALVERGPDWNTIIKIEVTLARICTPGLTIERA